MPDLSIALSSAELEEALLRVVDAEGKVPAALEALGPVIGRDVVVLDAGHGFRVRQLEEIGARVAAFQFPLSDDAAGELVVLIGFNRLEHAGGDLQFIGDLLQLEIALQSCAAQRVANGYHK